MSFDTMVRVVSGALMLLLVFILIQRRRKRAH
jgi:LPXTG-motif cell wall-anchored protein